MSAIQTDVRMCAIWLSNWIRASLVVQSVKNLPAMQKTWVRSLGWEDPWRRAWQPTPVFLPGESPWTDGPGGLQSTGSQRIGHDWATKHSTARLSTQSPSKHFLWIDVMRRGPCSKAPVNLGRRWCADNQPPHQADRNIYYQKRSCRETVKWGMHQTDDDTSFKPRSGAGKPVAEKGEEHERSSSPGPAELSPVWPGAHRGAQPRKSRAVWTAAVLESHTRWVGHSALMRACVCTCVTIGVAIWRMDVPSRWPEAGSPAVQAKERMRAGGWKETSNIRDTEDGIRLGGRVLRIKAGWGGAAHGEVWQVSPL